MSAESSILSLPIESQSSVSSAGFYPTEDPPFVNIARSARFTAGNFQEVPGMIRVSHQNIIGSNFLQVQITGMTGPDASKINGMYVSVDHLKEKSPEAGQRCTDMIEDQQVSCIHIAGAKGKNASFVNGIYDMVDELSCNKHVYIKRFDPQKCIHFWNGYWTVTEIEHKGKNGRGRASLQHDGSLESATSMDTWDVVDFADNKWVRQPDVRCAVGVGKFEGGLKKIDSDIWLECHAGRFSVCDAQDRHSDKGYIFCGIDREILSGDSFDFYLFCTPWLAQQPWYSKQKDVIVFHPSVSLKFNTFFPFTGVYHATESLSCSMPKFIRNGIDPHVIEYCDRRSTWIIKECCTDQVLATSCAVTSDFSIPILWTTSDQASAQQLPAISSTPSFNTRSNLDIASKSFFDLPISLSVVAAASAGLDSVLFEGNYEFCDWIQLPRKNALRVLYRHVESGHHLIFQISSLQIDSVCLVVEGEVVFTRCQPKSDVEEFMLLSSLLMDRPSFSLYIFKIPLVAEDAPAFQICSTKSVMSNPFKNAFQPRMMPMFTSPSCVNFVKDIVQQSNFDAKSFWRQTLAQMSGQTASADFHALHRTLVSCKYCSHMIYVHALTHFPRNFRKCCLRMEAPFCIPYLNCNTVIPFRDMCS
jgi:hypothetical protein